MARIRTIKPEFWTSEQVMECAPLTRLLFIGIWNFCDDAGNHPASAKTIKALVFPGDDIVSADVQSMLDELSSNGLITLYEANGKTYLHVLGWKHQKIDKPTIKYPASPNGSGVLAEASPNGSGGLPPGKEGEGKGKELTHTPGAPFAMFLEWVPDETILKTYSLMAGLPVTLFTRPAIAPFVCHHDAKGACRTEKEWVTALVNWIKRDKDRDARVVPLARRQANGPDFHSGDTSWANDLGDL